MAESSFDRPALTDDNFSERLRGLMEGKNLSLRSLSDEVVGVSFTYLSRLLKGDRKPSWQAITALAKALGVRPEWLAMEEGRKEAYSGLEEKILALIGTASKSELVMLGYNLLGNRIGTSEVWAQESLQETLPSLIDASLNPRW